MDFKSEQVLTKTPQGVNATRSGVGLSPKAYSMLKLFDGTMEVSAFLQVCKGASMSEVDFQSTLNELVQQDHLRIVAAGSAPAEPQASTAAERKMLLTLDFTVAGDLPGGRPARPREPAAAAAPAAPLSKVPPAAPAAPVPTPSAAVAADSAAEDRTARLKRETEIRQKLMVELQPRIEEELRTRLRPKLEQELRPKLIAALRPGVEGEVRTALIKELTPRVELELKARFAKTLAAQKTASEQAAVAEPAPAPAVPAAPPLDSAAERMLASLSVPLFTVDRTGVCGYVSPAWLQFSGFAANDVVGKPLVDLFADKDRRAIAALLSGIANGTALRFEQYGHLHRKEGEPLWVEVGAAPLVAASGETTGVCGVIRDATEAQRMADQAEADGVRLLLLVDQIDTGVILEDGAGNVQQANAALCTLLALEAAPYSLEGMPVPELLESAAKRFIGPEGFLRRVAEMRAATADSKGESFVMVDGGVIELDRLVVTVGDNTVGHVWLFRQMQRAQSRSAV